LQHWVKFCNLGAIDFSTPTFAPVIPSAKYLSWRQSKPFTQFDMNKVGTAYILWLGMLLQLHGLHRLYNGKVLTGLLWLCTFGLFGVGQLVDLLLIPRMVEDHNLRYQGRLGMSATGVPIVQAQVQEVIQQQSPPSTARQQLMVQLLKAAAERGGRLSVTQGVIDTGVGFAEVELTLKEMVKTGYVDVGNDLESGIIVYEFREL
jgi:hypothetical protein